MRLVIAVFIENLKKKKRIESTFSYIKRIFNTTGCKYSSSPNNFVTKKCINIEALKLF